MMENLAPAGDRAALERAEAAGADAVYLGYAAFSARAGAGNFDRAGLEEAIRFAHVRHMRVYVTVNTLIKDGELTEAADLLRLLRDLRADGVLIQDLGLLRIARSLCPNLPVHASTQMTIHNRTGAAWCREQGMKRVVLARECSLEEIRKACGAGIEIEVFGHGAQCVSVSGECLFSSMLGERSGNRGRCAQPCRLTWRYRGQEGAWLSPRDVCLRNDLPALEAAGVCSVKLEGRLKRPEYVAVTTAAYRKGINSLAGGAFETADEAETEGLLQAFNRGGFMRGYAFGCEDAGVICPGSVNHQGVEIGRLEPADGKLARLRLARDLHDGDGLEIRRGRESTGLVYAGPEKKAGETAVLRLRTDMRAERGDRVFRLTDAAQDREAAEMPGRRVEADMYLRAVPGEKLSLTAGDGENRVTVSGETVQAARTRAAEEDELIRNLNRTGDTVFIPRKTEIETHDAFVPVSEVNRLRREALTQLAEKRADTFAFHTAGEGSMPTATLPAAELPPMAVVRTREQAEAARETGLRVIRYPEDYRREALEALLQEMEREDWLRLPDVCGEDTLEMLQELTRKYRERLGGIMLGTVGQLGRKWPVPIAAGSGIPVMNRQAAAALLAEGCAFVTASPELTGQELRTLLAGQPPVTVTVYGRTRLMLLHHCPARTALGLRSGHGDCAFCDAEDPRSLRGQALEDRRGYRFPLLRQRLPEGCRILLMNSVATDLMDRGIPAGRTVELTTETAEESRRVLAAFSQMKRCGTEATTGHWKRPVE